MFTLINLNDAELQSSANDLDELSKAEKLELQSLNIAHENVQNLIIKNDPLLETARKKLQQLNRDSTSKQDSFLLDLGNQFINNLLSIDNEKYKSDKTILENEINKLVDELSSAGKTEDGFRDKLKLIRASEDDVNKKFKIRLEIVKLENLLTNSKYVDLALNSGIPKKHIDTAWINQNTNGDTDIFFGNGNPLNQHCGQYTINSKGVIVYKKEAWDPYNTLGY